MQIRVKNNPRENTMSVTDVGKSGPSHEFLTSQIFLLTLFAKTKFSRKFPNLQYTAIKFQGNLTNIFQEWML